MATSKQNVVRDNYSLFFKNVVKNYSLLQNCSLLQYYFATTHPWIYGHVSITVWNYCAVKILISNHKYYETGFMIMLASLYGTINTL